MASDAFNSLGGYTVGIPPIEVISDDGRVLANVSAEYVNSGTVLTDNLRYSNGQTYLAGSNTQVQYNNAGRFGSSANFVFNNSNKTLSVTNILIDGATQLSDISNVSILGGENGYVLQTDGLGTLSWAAGGGGGGNGSPGGSNTQVQFNDNGDFGGISSFTVNRLTGAVNANTITANTFTGNLIGSASSANTVGTVTNNAQPNITSVGTLSGLTVGGTTVSILFSGSGASLTSIPAANIVGSISRANTVTDNAQPNITSLGTLTSVSSTGVISTTANITGANINASNRVAASNIFATNNVNVGGTLIVTAPGNFSLLGNMNSNTSPNITLGIVDNVHITGGFNGYVLQTDGTGNLSWSAAGGNSGNGTPGGSNTQIQFNDAGIFGGNVNLTYNKTTSTLQVSGNLIANTVTIGSGVYSFATTSVYAATTSSSGANQVLWTVPSADVCSVDFTIISTDVVSNTRQTSKISSMILGDTVVFNEYAGLHINGGVGSFAVGYNAGDIVNPPTLQLKISPSSANLTNYNMLITTYAEECIC